MYISNGSHHKHTRYLIQNSEIFGLGDRDLLVTSLVARYHRRATPKPTHSDFMSLPPDMRLAVIQLAAVLRIADALDTSHEQRLGDVTFDLEDDTLVIATHYQGSLAVEKMALDAKGVMFAEVFGRRPVLVTVKPGAAKR
jgi:exopolyphosphatase/guanosine-5'-triphosphate,3'-diphosphate pyrophosphatase